MEHNESLKQLLFSISEQVKFNNPLTRLCTLYPEFSAMQNFAMRLPDWDAGDLNIAKISLNNEEYDLISTTSIRPDNNISILIQNNEVAALRFYKHKAEIRSLVAIGPYSYTFEKFKGKGIMANYLKEYFEVDLQKMANTWNCSDEYPMSVEINRAGNCSVADALRNPQLKEPLDIIFERSKRWKVFEEIFFALGYSSDFSAPVQIGGEYLDELGGFTKKYYSKN